ncbi:hypothetical protein J5N97_003580 [Dioscorea zingiberensis]|uniref:Uncharacterized protein n=1 Tax=Dioscorea zingiberensis TaxID=325984 RepID=A0A9D5D636_9LILI|nr:hypothetical protein J5N97_003580 [Dioscorea zingiberensis]
MANIEMRVVNQISTLQALLAHVWRSVTRARSLDPDQEIMYTVLVGNRKLVTPPLPEAYLGNAVFWIAAKAKAGDVIKHGLGWAAWLLNQEIVLCQNEGEVRRKLAAWTEEPSFVYADDFKSTNIGTGSSPRFNVYGNDFGWGRPIAVRSGSGSKVDGKVTVYPGPDAGSMALEICLARHVLLSLLADGEFMEAVTCV